MKKIPIVLCAAAVLSSALLAGSALASSANAKEYAPVDDALVVSVTTTAEEQVDDTAPSTAPFSFRMELPDPSKYDGMTDEERQEAMKADLKAALDKKVADGVLTQTQADKILERVDKMPGDRPKAFRGFFGKDNLFGAELDLSKYEGMTDEERQQAIKADLKAALDKKVADGTLTQAQADKFLEHVDKMPGDGVKMFGSFCGKDNLFGTELDLSKYEGMTDEERREAIKADLKAALDKKVADGTLTQAQADKMM